MYTLIDQAPSLLFSRSASESVSELHPLTGRVELDWKIKSTDQWKRTVVSSHGAKMKIILVQKRFVVIQPS